MLIGDAIGDAFGAIIEMQDASGLSELGLAKQCKAHKVWTQGTGFESL